MTAYRKAHGGFWIYDCFAARPFAHRALSTANTTILWGFARARAIGRLDTSQLRGSAENRNSSPRQIG
ncbi:hypothetical protein VCV18_002032 [Metarhizium anisopliae]